MAIETEFITLKMTAGQARALRGVIACAINDMREKRKWRDLPEEERAALLHLLGAFDDRLYDVFYKYQRN